MRTNRLSAALCCLVLTLVGCDGSEDRMAVIIIGKDRQLVVTAHRQPAMLVGNGKTVVRIEMIGVERLFVVVDG